MYSKIVTLENVPVSATIKIINASCGDPNDSDMDHEIIAIPADDPESTKESSVRKIAQKLMGAAIVTVSILAGMLDGDGTAAVLMVPLGLWLMFTKSDAIY